MPTRQQFAAIFSALFASAAWASATPAQRLTHVEDTLKALPVLWDLIKNFGETVLENLYKNLRKFGEPDPPAGTIDDYTDLWYFAEVGAALEWSIIPPIGGDQ